MFKKYPSREVRLPRRQNTRLHTDRDAVRELYTRLTKNGMDAWLDKERLLPGQDWEMEFHKAVRKADAVVLLTMQINQAGF